MSTIQSNASKEAENRDYNLLQTRNLEGFLNEVSGSIRTEESVEIQVQRQNTREALRAKDIKDVVLPAALEEEEGYIPGQTTVKLGQTAQKPNLPTGATPSSNSDSELGDPDNISIIAIIGQVLALQARTNSNFWSIIWQQASTSMDMAVKLAPILATATQNNWNAQATSTMEDAQMSKGDGLGGMISGGIALAMGVAGALKTDDVALNAGATKTPLANAVQNADQNVSEKIAENDSQLSGQASRAAQSAKGLWSKITTNAFKALKGAGDFGQYSMALSNAVQQFTNDAPHKMAMAAAQRQAGSADALTKVTEQYSQYYTQDFNRNEDLRRSAEQNIETATGILRSASDSVTQVVVGMFRG